MSEKKTHSIAVSNEHARRAMDLSRTILASCWAGPEVRQLATLVEGWLRTPVLEWTAYEDTCGDCWEAVIPRVGVCRVEPVLRQGTVRWEGSVPGDSSGGLGSPDEAKAWCQAIADEMFGAGGTT